MIEPRACAAFGVRRIQLSEMHAVCHPAFALCVILGLRAGPRERQSRFGSLRRNPLVDLALAIGGARSNLAIDGELVGHVFARLAVLSQRELEVLGHALATKRVPIARRAFV